MNKRAFLRRGIGVVLATSALALMQPAMADSLTFNGLFYSGADTVHIGDTTAPAINEYVYSGGFSMKDTTGPWTIGGVTTAKNASFMAWCIDVRDNMNSANYTLKTDELSTTGGFVPTTKTPLNSARVEALERLASNDLALVNNAKTSSAFQLAAWEIMAENSSSYNLTGGNFTVWGDALGADTLAQTWLNTLGTATPTMELYVWQQNTANSTQDLAVFAPSPVPEPETYAMMLAGLGLMGFMARRRKQNEAA